MRIFFLLFMTNAATVCLFLCFQLIYLKLTALLFPTSDFRHPVTTPALLYISQALTKVHTVFSVFIICVFASNGVSPSLILFESSPPPLISHLFLCAFSPDKKKLSIYICLKRFLIIHYKLSRSQQLYEVFFWCSVFSTNAMVIPVCVFPPWSVHPQCPVRSLQDVTSGLVLCCLAVEYVSFSKRFLPELINFLAGTLHLAVQDKTSIGSCTLTFNNTFPHACVGARWHRLWHCVAGYTVVPPFRPSGKCSDLLVLSDSESCKSWNKKSLPLSATQHLELKSDLDRDHHR